MRVQWQEQDLAWHTGIIVRLATSADPNDTFIPKDGYGGVLVKHDHTGKLEFVKESKLQRRPRDEFEPDLVAPTIGPAKEPLPGAVDCTLD